MRKLCWWALPCSGAIFLAVYLLPEAFLLPAGALCVLGALGSLLFRGSARLRIALAALGLAFGFLWTGCYGLLFRAPAQALISEEARPYTMTVLDFPYATSRGAALPVRLEAGAKAQVYADEDALDLRPGDVISCPLRLASSGTVRGESVDYYTAKGIYLLGYAQDGTERLARPQRPSPLFWPQYAARSLKDSIARVFPDDVSGFLSALVTGDKASLPTGVYAAFQRAGISHVIAVSGLHIGFLAGLLSLLLGKRSRLSAGVGITLMFFYAAVAGSSPSALRAASMCTLLLIAPLVGREPDKPTALAAVLFLLLLPCPYAAASVSLQLSFAAVAGIYLVSEALSRRWRKAVPKWDKALGKLGRQAAIFVLDSLAVTLGALLFTTPLAALHFGSVSLVGPLSNLLTLWAISYCFLGGLFSALLGLFLPPLGFTLAWLTAWPARGVLWTARNIARWPFASVSLSSRYLIFWFLVAYGIFLLWLMGRRRVRPLIPISVLSITLCAALFTNSWDTLTSRLTVAALDVGQGASTLFYSKGHTLLVDCGGNSGDDPGDIAADALQALGTSRLDALILTHCHTDHACGVPQLLSRVEVSLLILPEGDPEDSLRQEILSLAEDYGCKVEVLSSDAHITFGEADLQLYAPLGDGGINEAGLSLLCSVGEFDVLITGDMNDVVERRLVKYKNLPDIEVLMVGHHGSKNATSEALLLALRPEAAVISSGYNSYGHPALETLERLGAAGCDIYRTDLMGTITFTVKETDT